MAITRCLMPSSEQMKECRLVCTCTPWRASMRMIASWQVDALVAVEVVVDVFFQRLLRHCFYHHVLGFLGSINDTGKAAKSCPLNVMMPCKSSAMMNAACRASYE